MGGVGGYVATFVVTEIWNRDIVIVWRLKKQRRGERGRGDLPVDGEVQAHEFGQFGVVESKHFGVIGRPIQFRIDRTDSLTALICVAVDGGGNDWQLGNQVNAVFVSGIPVLGFVDTLNIKEKNTID